MEVTASIDYERGVSKDGQTDTITGHLEITNWNEQVKIQGGILGDTPIYVDRGDLLRALAALETAAA